MLVTIIAWIILGGLAGWIAGMLVPGDEGLGVLGTIVLGIVGALVGGFISTRLGFGDVTGFNLPSIIIAVAGSILLLFIYRMIRR